MIKKIFIILISFYSLNAQSFDGSSLGMAGNYSAMSKGIDALNWNPANLAAIRGNNVEINFMSLRGNLYNNSFSWYDYNRFFTLEGHGGNWSEIDKEAIYRSVNDDGMRFSTDASINLLGFAINNIAFAVQAVEQGVGVMSANKTPYKMALFGDSFTKDYSYVEPELIKADFYAAIKTTLGYAYPFNLKLFPGFKFNSAGMNFNYFMGNTVAQTVSSEVSLVRSEIEGSDITQYRTRIKARYSIPGIMAGNMDIDPNNIDETSGITSGSGWGIDLGTSFNFIDKFDISWSFSNLFASINWNTNTLMFMQEITDSLETTDLLEGKQGENYSTSDTTVNTENFSTPLPSVMRLGVAFHILKDVTLSAEYRQGLDKYFGNSTTPRFGAGVEYMATPMLPLRAGITFGGKYGYLLGLGSGFHSSFFHFDFSTAFSRAAMPSASTGIFISLSFKFLF